MVLDSAWIPECSVVICTRDRPAYLDRCLAALAALNYPRFEILVVDNAPSDGRAREIASRRSVRYVVEAVAGLSRARNRGAAQSTGDIVAYLDDDAIAEPGWLGGLAAEFTDARVMAVAGRVIPLDPAGEEGRKCAAIAGTDRGPQRRIFDLETPDWFKFANFGGIGIGANMAMRRSAFSVWPGFNPRLGRGAAVPACEENHAFSQMIAAGYRVVYTPAAVVRHHAPQNTVELRQQHLKTLVEAGAYFAFLLTERADYRAATVGFVVAGIRGRRHTQGPDASSTPRIAPLWREALAGIRGAMLYTRARLAERALFSRLATPFAPGSHGH
jgi:O-antigen biosynthesis protein